jgi:hypothetical protein
VTEFQQKAKQAPKPQRGVELEPNTVSHPQSALYKQLVAANFAIGQALVSAQKSQRAPAPTEQGPLNTEQGPLNTEQGPQPEAQADNKAGQKPARPKVDAEMPSLGERSADKYMEPPDERVGPILKPIDIDIADVEMNENGSAPVKATVHDPDNPGKTEHLWFEWSQLSGPRRKSWKGTFGTDTSIRAPEVWGDQYMVGELAVFKRGHWAPKGLKSTRKFMVKVRDIGDPTPELPPVVDPQHPDCGKMPVIAAGEKGRVWGDPHFVGGDGGKFDVQGEAGKTYNLLSDSGVTLYGQFHRWKQDGLTVVGKTELTTWSAEGMSRVVMHAKSDVYMVDSQNLDDGRSIVMKDGGTTTRKGRELITMTREGYKITQSDKGGYINADVETGKKGVYNGRMPTGLIGQTFDADDKARDGKKGKGAQGEGAIDGVHTDYEVEMGNRPPLGAGCGIAPVVAAREKAKVWGDPHFQGADGGKFDVQGQAGKTYNLLSDSNLKWHGTFIGTKPGITWVGQTLLEVKGEAGTSAIHFDSKKNCYTVNGQALVSGQSMVLADGGMAELRGNTLTVTTSEGYKITQHDKGGHIDAEVVTGDRGAYNGCMPTGLMGHTFDADHMARNGKKGKGAQGEGAITGTVADYEVR